MITSSSSKEMPSKMAATVYRLRNRTNDHRVFWNLILSSIITLETTRPLLVRWGPAQPRGPTWVVSWCPDLKALPEALPVKLCNRWGWRHSITRIQVNSCPLAKRLNIKTKSRWTSRVKRKWTCQWAMETLPLKDLRANLGCNSTRIWLMCRIRTPTQWSHSKRWTSTNNCSIATILYPLIIRISLATTWARQPISNKLSNIISMMPIGTPPPIKGTTKPWAWLSWASLISIIWVLHHQLGGVLSSKVVTTPLAAKCWGRGISTTMNFKRYPKTRRSKSKGWIRLTKTIHSIQVRTSAWIT